MIEALIMLLIGTVGIGCSTVAATLESFACFVLPADGGHP